MIYATAKTELTCWDEIIWKVELGLPASKNATTKFSPFEILYGFTPRLHAYQQKIEKQNDVLRIRSEIVKRNEEIESFKHKFMVGQSVMIRSAKRKVGIDEKRYFGPGKITQLKGHKSYLFEVFNKIIHRHEDHLKGFKGIIEKHSDVSTSIQSRAIISDNVRRYPQRSRMKTSRYGFYLLERGCNT